MQTILLQITFIIINIYITLETNEKLLLSSWNLATKNN